MNSPEATLKQVRARDLALKLRRYSPQESLLQLVAETQDLPGAQEPEFHAALVCIIEREDRELSHFAIEYLVSESTGCGAARLATAVLGAKQTEPWFAQSLLGLLRVANRPIGGLAAEYVEKHLGDADFPLALLTQLIGVAPEAAVQLGSHYLVNALPAATADQIESLAQAFANGYLRHKSDRLCDLVITTVRRDQPNGRRFGKAMIEAVRKPWVSTRFGPIRGRLEADRIRTHLGLAG